MKEESVSRIEILENILDFYSVQPGMNKNGKLEKIEEYLLLIHALYSRSLEELKDLNVCDADFLETIFDCFNTYINAVGEEIDKIFEEDFIGLNPILVSSKGAILPVQAIEMIRGWNKSSHIDWSIEEELLQLEDLVASDLFFERFLRLIENVTTSINSRLFVAVEKLI